MKLIEKIDLLSKHVLDMMTFKSSESYWLKRYKRGGNSGSGSYGSFAQFKADVINKFVETNNIKTVVEFGCGDGNQLTLANYPFYIGFDISPEAIEQCRKIFDDDSSKEFYVMSEYKEQEVDLSLSLDVIYHLIEDNIFEKYMRQLFCSSKRYVIVYSSNTGARSFGSPHVRHRQFTSWVKTNFPDWDLIMHIPNPQTGRTNFKGNIRADFFIYQKSHSLIN